MKLAAQNFVDQVEGRVELESVIAIVHDNDKPFGLGQA